MSEVMTSAVIGMPFEMAMSDEVSRIQFYQRANKLLNDYAALKAERDTLRAQLAALKAPAVVDEQEAEQCLFVLREIGSMDADDIGGDDIDLRFEDADGRDTGCDVSIVEYAERAADLIERLLAARPAQTEQRPIGYTTTGMLEIAQALPLTGRIGVRCRADERWNVPVYAAPIAQTPADWQTFMGEPLVQPYEAPRKQVNELFTLLGFKGQAEVGAILDAAISAIKAAQPADGLVEAAECVMRAAKWWKENTDSPKSALIHFARASDAVGDALAAHRAGLAQIQLGEKTCE